MLVDVLTQKKELFLAKLKEKSNFAALREDYQDEWEFHDLLRDLTDDEDFKQICIDKTATESAGKSFKEDIDKCVELAEQGKRAASKYFKKGVKLQAYYTKINNADRVLNVNLIHYDKSEPTRISDILQQEKDIKELNIYCNKKHEIHAYRKDKKRYYEFKEGAYYEMTSTWPVKDEFGNVSICTMTMNVSSDGITEILKFNGKDFVLSEEILELIKQNDELYIQGLSLHGAVMKLLEKSKADGIPTANNNLQSESIVAYQDKEPEGKLDPKVDADNSLPPSSINSNVLIQTEVKLQQIATQTEIDLQHTETQTKIDSQQIETQTEVNLQHTETQTEVASQQIETQTEVNLQHTGTQTEVASQQIGIQTEINSQQMDELILNNQTLSKENVKLKQEMSNLKKEIVELKEEKSDLEDKLDQLKHLYKKMNENLEQLLKQVLGLQKESSESKEENQALSNELESAKTEKKRANQELAEAEQRIEALKKQTSDLQDKLEKKEREFKAKIDAMYKKLTQLEENLKRNEEEFKSVDEEKRRLEDRLKIVNAEKKESEDKLKEFEKEIDQAAHIMKEKEQFISNLKRQMQELEDEYKAQQESSKQEICNLAWRVEELRSELERENEWDDKVVEMLNGLEEKIRADGQRSLNDQFYILTGNISSESDNVPRKKRKLSGSFSLDSTYYSDEENCDNGLSSGISPISFIEEVAESRNVRRSPAFC